MLTINLHKTNALRCTPLNTPHSLAGFEPGLSIPETNPMITAPGHQDHFKRWITDERSIHTFWFSSLQCKTAKNIFLTFFLLHLLCKL
jgi:hypothetical protein